MSSHVLDGLIESISVFPILRVIFRLVISPTVFTSCTPKIVQSVFNVRAFLCFHAVPPAPRYSVLLPGVWGWRAVSKHLMPEKVRQHDLAFMLIFRVFVFTYGILRCVSINRASCVVDC